MTEQAKALEAAEDRLKAAESAHTTEVKRLEMATTTLWGLDEELAAIDPDADSSGFDRVVAKRTKARARIDALSARAQKAQGVIEPAKEAFTEARRAWQVALLAEIDVQHLELAHQLDEEARGAQARLAPLLADLRELLAQADAIDRELHPDRYTGVYWISPRSNQWGGVNPGAELLAASERVAELARVDAEERRKAAEHERLVRAAKEPLPVWYPQPGHQQVVLDVKPS
jgi:hypothetical protein